MNYQASYRRIHTIKRISDALGLPVKTFFEEGSAHSSIEKQALRLAEIFLTIEDPAIRQKCLDFVSKAAGDTSNVAEAAQ